MKIKNEFKWNQYMNQNVKMKIKNLNRISHCFQFNQYIQNMNILQECGKKVDDCLKNCPPRISRPNTNQNKGLIENYRCPKSRWTITQISHKNEKRSLKAKKPLKGKNKQNQMKSAQNLQPQHSEKKIQNFEPERASKTLYPLTKLSNMQSIKEWKQQNQSKKYMPTNAPALPQKSHQRPPITFISRQVNKLKQIDFEKKITKKTIDPQKLKISFTYKPFWAAPKIQSKQPEETMTFHRTTTLEHKQSQNNSPVHKLREMKKNSVQHLKQNSEFNGGKKITQSLKHEINFIVEKQPLKKIISEVQMMESEESNPQIEEKPSIEKKRHFRRNSDFQYSTIRSNSIEDMLSSNKINVSVGEEDEDEEEIVESPRNFIKRVNTQNLLIREEDYENQQENKKGGFNLSAFTINNNLQMENYKKTESIHESAESEFSEVIQISNERQNSDIQSNFQFQSLPNINFQNKMSQPYPFSEVKMKKNRMKRESLTQST